MRAALSDKLQFTRGKKDKHNKYVIGYLIGYSTCATSLLPFELSCPFVGGSVSVGRAVMIYCKKNAGKLHFHAPIEPLVT